jgi:hypothetical protein
LHHEQHGVRLLARWPAIERCLHLLRCVEYLSPQRAHLARRHQIYTLAPSRSSPHKFTRSGLRMTYLPCVACPLSIAAAVSPRGRLPSPETPGDHRRVGRSMESTPDLLHQFVRALALVAMSLDRWFHIPWPLPVAVLFEPILAALDVVIWNLRGTVFPIACGYPRVKQGLCTRPTFGEWHKCWYHRRWRLRRTDRHQVDPNLRRWETKLLKGKTVENTGFRAAAFSVCGAIVTPFYITKASHDLAKTSSE